MFVIIKIIQIFTYVYTDDIFILNSACPVYSFIPFYTLCSCILLPNFDEVLPVRLRIRHASIVKEVMPSGLQAVICCLFHLIVIIQKEGFATKLRYVQLALKALHNLHGSKEEQ